MKKIRIIDLFAGIGGIRKGFERAFNGKVDCVLTSEIDKFAVQSYQENYPGEKVLGDITQINESEVPDHDILLAGFPCQPFSQAGLKKGFDDTRGTLFFDIERIIIAKQPRVFVLENVKRLRTHDGGRTLEIILKSLKNAGYSNTQYAVLKARDFGLPQNRERIFIVGFLDESIKFEFPKPLETSTRVGDILDDDVDPKYTISDKLWTGHQRRKRENKLKGKGFGYGMVKRDSEYTNTISARYYKDGSEILVHQEGKNPRKITPREAARLQGFDENYRIIVSDAQAYKQFGNSVAINVVQAVAEQVKKSIDLADLSRENTSTLENAE